MASNSSFSSDVAGISSTKRKRKVVSIEKKLEICCRHEMGQSYTSLSKEYGLGKSPIHDIVQSEDRLTEYAMEYNMLQDQKEALSEDPSMTSWIRLFTCGFYRYGQWMKQQEETMLFQKLKNDSAKKRSAILKQLSMNDFVL